MEEAYSRYCAIEEKLENDEELKHLKQRLREDAAAFHAVLSRLSEDDRTVIREYFGICAEIDQRIVELACFCDK